MLVLTRTVGKAVVILDPRTGHTIEVVVAEVQGDTVRLGIIAPREVVVDRSEVAAQRVLHPRTSDSEGPPAFRP